MTKPCTRCGKCCTNKNYMGTLSATEEDVQRWTKEKRWDILQYVDVMTPGFGGDLWIPESGEELLRCPFVRKDRNLPTYKCTIYETRPQVCRDYVPWSSLSICEEVTS